MNEELQKAIAELFQSAISAKDFLVSELPEYVEQLLMWHAVHSFIWFVVGVAAVIFALFLPGVVKARYRKRIAERKKEAKEALERKESWCFYGSTFKTTSSRYDRIVNADDELDREDLAPVYMATVVIGLLGVVAVGCNQTWLKIWIAPKVWLVEYAASLIR